MPLNSLPPWPPSLPHTHLTHLHNLATTHALAHGFTHLPPNPSTPPSHTFAAPLSLFPSPFPRHLFELACEIQTVYNALYARIALDWDFLDRVMGGPGGVAKVDSFQGELWSGWKRVRDELVQPLQLGVFRSDYLLHSLSSLSPLELKQVEFNTIAASFGSLSQKASEQHRYLARETDMYFSSSPYLSSLDNYPVNDAMHQIAAGLADGWRAYGRSDAVVLVVAQEGERNVFDQIALQYELLNDHGIKTVRHTFAELADLVQLDRNSKRLLLPDPLQDTAEPREVAVIYYRSAYTPTDYPSATEWGTRMLLERSRAIKCPSMALQLAGAKKVQQVLTEPGVLEDFLLGPDRPDVGFGKGAGNLTEEDVEKVRRTWIGLWPMDNSPLGQEAYRLATTQSHRFVLKPQREGGGNNIYRSDIPAALRSLERDQHARRQQRVQLQQSRTRRRDEDEEEDDAADAKEAYILMELITPPQGVSNWLVRGGETKARKADVVSELGIYGVTLFGHVPDTVGSAIGTAAQAAEVEIVNREAGFLLRTKGRESDEGGVAIGISSIDSPVLVDVV